MSNFSIITLVTGRGRTMQTNTKRPGLSAAAARALQEADERRRTKKPAAETPEPEIGGPQGPDPVRYGDWEKDGIASDF
jgi:hypothetical protein